MPQAIAAVIGTLSGPLGVIPAAIANLFGINLSGGLIGNLLGLGPKGEKPQQAERTVKNTAPPRVYGYGERLLYGAQMLFETAANGSTADVWAFHDGQADGFVALYINDEAAEISGGFVTGFADKSYGNSKVKFGYNLGLATETAFAPVVSLLPTIWTSAHRGDGIVSAYLTKAPESDKKFLERYPQGDNVTVAMALRLQRCFDPREGGHDPDDASTWAYTTNAALHLLHYYMVRRDYDYGTRLEPVIAYWITAADACDEAVALAAGGTEPRYRGCVVYDSTMLPANVVAELLACFDGWTSHDENGCVTVFAGKFYEPTVSIGPDQIVAYSHQSFVEEEDVVNELIIRHVSKEHDYKTVDAEPWRDEADISARGRVISDGLDLQIPSHTQGRRLAKRAALRRNSPNRGSVTTNIEGRGAIGHRFINLLIEEAGATFYDGVAEIVDLERDYDTGGVTFNWIGVPEGVDDWDEETEEGAAAPDATGLAAGPLTAPTIGTIDAFLSGNGARFQLQTAVEAPGRDDITWVMRWRVDGEAEWSPEKLFPDETEGTATLNSDLVSTGQDIEVQVAYRLGDGRYSDWSDASTVETETPDPAPPSDGIIYDGQVPLEPIP